MVWKRSTAWSAAFLIRASKNSRLRTLAKLWNNPPTCPVHPQFGQDRCVATLAVDRPFIFLIRDHATAAVLLLVGRGANPS